MHCLALQLVDELAASGIAITAEDDGGFDTSEAPSDALCARLAAFLGPDVPGAITAPRRALRAVLRARDRAARELLALPVALTPLPKGQGLIPYTARFERLTAGGARVAGLLTTSGPVYEREHRARPTFLARELVTAALAVESGRAGPLSLDRWLAAKARGPWTLLPELAGLPPLRVGEAPRPPTLTVGELFDELGAELITVELHGAANAASEAA